MQLDGQYHPIWITIQNATIERSGRRAQIEVKGEYTVLGTLMRACKTFDLPDSSWLKPQMYLEISQTGRRLENGLLLCETDVCENMELTLRPIDLEKWIEENSESME